MFKEIRRKDRELDSEKGMEMLTKGEYGILSMVDANGWGYGVPLSYVYFEGSIYFHCALEGSKIENLENNNKVSFCVVGDTSVLAEKFSTLYQSVIVFGKAQEASGEEKHRVLVALLDKYSKDFMKEGLEYINRAQDRTKVIKVNIDRMTVKGRLL